MRELLEISATAEDVNISPMRIAEFVESQKEKQEKAAKKAADKGETYTAPILRDQAYIAKGLSRILGVEQETLETRMTKTNYDYWNIKKRADQTVSTKFAVSSTARSTLTAMRCRNRIG